MSVVSGSPAYYSGLHEGDIIVQVDKERITNLHDLLSQLWKKKAREVTLRIIRGEKELTTKAKLVEAPTR